MNGINPATGTRPFASLTNSTIGYTNYQGNSDLEASRSVCAAISRRAF
ncbi:MAG: hypothetical protein WDO73_02580 [Ignavibacteriota bacterium]